jgi:uncharacterized protein
VSVRIRTAELRDLAAIRAVNAAGRPGVTPLSDDELRACVERASHFRVAEDADGVSGYLLALAEGFADVGDEYAWFSARHTAFLYVDQIAVAERARREGVGTALYADLERAARARGTARLTCEVNLRPPNPRSLAFHARLGFVEVGRLEVSDGRFVSLLERELG